MARAFGFAALVGLALLLLCIPLGMLMRTVEDGNEHPVFVVPLLLGIILTSAGWIMWGSWSATLDRYSEPLSTTAKLTLASTAAIVLGVLCLMGAAVPVTLYIETNEPPGWALPVVIVVGGLGVLLVAGTIVAGAVGGGIALGGPRWWWVGALLSVCLAAVGGGGVGRTHGFAPTTQTLKRNSTTSPSDMT